MVDKKIINFYNNKKILVTGGTGLIGRPLVEKLISYGAQVSIVSLDEKPKIKGKFYFYKSDLREFKNCLFLCKGKDIVFHLAGVKGSPLMTARKPASFLVPTVTFTFNMMEAARRCGVKRFLLTSSIGVYAQAKIFKEDTVWKTFPSKHDRFAGWAKRLCELQAEAYKIQYNWDSISIIRPANVYGPFDNFDAKNAMVIPSLIKKIIKSKKQLDVWGDGSPIRDFIFSDDVADGMVLAVYKKVNYPINIGSGRGVTIKSLVETIVSLANKNGIKINWQRKRPSGDIKRLMDTTKAKSLGFIPKTSLSEGIQKTIKWFLENKSKNKKYNSFTEKI